MTKAFIHYPVVSFVKLAGTSVCLVGDQRSDRVILRGHIPEKMLHQLAADTVAEVIWSYIHQSKAGNS